MNENQPKPPTAQRDVLAEWLALGREVLARYYPDAEYGSMVIKLKDGVPNVILPITHPPVDPRPSSPPA